MLLTFEFLIVLNGANKKIRVNARNIREANEQLAIQLTGQTYEVVNSKQTLLNPQFERAHSVWKNTSTFLR